MDPFILYLQQALQQAQEKFPGEDFLLYSGEYRPNIGNLNYAYYFGSSVSAVKVVADVSSDGTTFIVNSIPQHDLHHLSPIPIALPVHFSLMQSYEWGVSRGYRLNLGDAIVFLQNQRDIPPTNEGSSYWFLEVGSDSEWIRIYLSENHPIVRSDLFRPLVPGK